MQEENVKNLRNLINLDETNCVYLPEMLYIAIPQNNAIKTDHQSMEFK